MKPHSNIFFFLIIFSISVLGLISCGDIQQEVYLNSNGSGKLETSIDAGEFMSMANGLENMGFDQDTFSDDQIPDTLITTPEPEKDPMKKLVDRITDPAHDQDFDTLFSIMSIMPDSIKEKVMRPDLMDKISIRMKSPANSAGLTFGIAMEFDNYHQLREIIESLGSLADAPDIANAASMGMGPESFLDFEVDMKEGWIRFDTVDYTKFGDQLGMSQDSAMSSEDLGMMEMMFGNTKVRTIVHVPGEVIKCSHPDAILTKDNKVIIEHPFMEAIRKGKINGYTIHFKP